MTAVLLPNGRQQYFTTPGVPAVGYKIATFDAGTSNPRTTWVDALKVGTNTNPIILDARGEASIFWEGAYKVQLQDSTGAVIWTQDNLQSVQNGFSASLLPAVTNTVDLGSAALSWRNVYVGPNNAPVLDTITGNIGYFARTQLEINAGVTPVNFSYPPYIVQRYGAVGNGVIDDTIAFNLAGGILHDIGVPETGSTYVLNSQVTGLFYAIGQPRFTSNYQRIGLVDEVGTALQENNSGVVGAFPRTASILVIGDSITEGTGASSYLNSWSWLFGRSLMNAFDEGIFRDSGFGYHSILNFSNIQSSPGVTTNGTISANGIWGARLLLTAAAQSLQFINREITAVSIYYNASASSGSFNIQLNGVTVSTVVVGGVGVVTTGFKFLKTNNILTRISDTITIVPVGAGVLEIAAVITSKNSAVNACIVHVGGKSGYAYQDYNTAGAMDELAVYLNSTVELGGAQPKVLICQLGTNNMYNAGRTLTPAATVTAIATLLAGMVGRCTNLQIAISIPPKSNETLFPMINATFKYEDYVRALVAYGVANNITLLRHDRGALNSGAYYADGLHPNNVGHTLFAQTTLKAVKVKFDAYFKSTANALPDYLTFVRTDAVITMNSTWGPFSALAGFAARAHLVAGNLILSGVVIPNGSVAPQIGTLPAGFIPDQQDRYVILNKNVSGGALGTTRLKIDHTTGALTLDAVPTNDVALDGVCIPLYKFIES